MARISVIIPTYNRPKELKRAVQSVLDQEIDGLEIIIIDDASDSEFQGAFDVISNQDTRVFVKKNTVNAGVSACRNIGIKAATGSYILFLDDDDVLLPEMLRRSLEVIEKEGVDVVSCRSEVIGDHIPQKRLKAYNRQQRDTHQIYEMSDRAMEHLFLYHPQVHSFLIRREAIGMVRFLSEHKYGEDMLFWFALALNGLKFKKLNFVGCRYHLHQSNASRGATYEAKKKFYQAVLNSYTLSREMQNICWFKVAMLAMVQGDLRFSIWLFKCLQSPVLFFRHASHYIRLLI